MARTLLYEVDKMAEDLKELDIPEDQTQEQPEEEHLQDEQEEAQLEEQQEEEAAEPMAEAEEDDDSLSVVIGEDEEEGEELEEDDKKDPSLVRHLRKTVKDVSKREKTYKRELEEMKQRLSKYEKPDEVDMSPRQPPKLSDPDIDYDEEKLVEKTREFVAWEAKVEQQKREAAQREEEHKKTLQLMQENYNQSKANLGASDYKEAEDVVVESLNNDQQVNILRYAKDPALLVYALGKNPERVEELAKIDDHGLFALALRDLESKVKPVKSKKLTPKPERKLNGAGKAATAETTLEQLEAEADRTGDRSKIRAYRRQMREQS